MWVQKLLAATGRDSGCFGMDWRRAEGELGTRLPADYKALCEAFGVGVFSRFVEIMAVDEEGGPDDLVRHWKRRLEGTRSGLLAGSARSLYAPYRLYEPGSGGLIEWASAEGRELFFWLADDGDPGSWPVLVHVPDAPPGEWLRYEMPATEFLYRLLTEADFGPFPPVAQVFPRPRFETLDEVWTQPL
ncbi:SMI1/KNR4 family protein [Streptomyces sp. MAR4 CNX-425]|uniref:SMI1/KNR4 family protein n=1 Tax=Streptomyces sp. MAR4 CNX-425 TaxID=3406343 RepID=UPI003B50E03A